MIKAKYLMISVFLVLVVPYILLGIFAYFRAESMIFRPQEIKDICIPNHTDTTLKLTTPSGEKITALFFENPKAEYTILYSHGNAEDILDIGVIFEQLREAGFNVLAYDYRGYGTSEGNPSEKNSYEDIETAYNYLVNEQKISPEKIIIHGRSLGGAVSIDLASKKKCGGLIVESSFVSAFRVMTGVPIYPFDKFESIKKIGNIKCPILIIHGTNDTLIPFWHGQKLFEAASEPKTFVPIENADHNDVIEVGGRKYFEAIQKFNTN